MEKINKHKFRIDLVSILSLFIFCITFVIANSPYAAGSDTDKNGPLEKQKEAPSVKTPRTLMRDSQTGYAVFPDEIIIIDTNTNKTVYHKKYSREEAMKEFKGGAFPTMPDLPPGNYKYIIQAKGYKPISSHFFIGSKTPPRSQQELAEGQLKHITFFLSPIETPPELKHEVLHALKREDSQVLVGFIVDDDTGLPLSNATVSTLDKSITAKTNERGFFIIRFPLPPEYTGSAEWPKINIIYEKNGYRSEVEEHYELMPRGVAMTRVWLKPGKGKRIVEYRTKIERIEP